MPNEMKIYKPLAIVFYTDESGLTNSATIEDSMADAFIEQMEDSKFVTIWWITINTFSIKSIKRDSQLTDTEKVYYSQPVWFKDYVMKRLKWLNYDWDFFKFNREIDKDKTLEFIIRRAKDFKYLQRKMAI